MNLNGLAALLATENGRVVLQGAQGEQFSSVATIDQVKGHPDINHAIFVGYVSTFLNLEPALRVGTFVLARDEDLDIARADAPAVTIVEIDNSSNLVSIADGIEHALRIEQHDESLMDQLLPLFLHTNDLQALAQVASDVLGNPILVTDSSYNILAHSRHRDLDDDIWKTGWQRGYLTFEFIAQLKGEGSSGFEDDATRTSIIVPNISEHRRFVHKLSMQSLFLGYLIVLEAFQPFERVDQKRYGIVRDFLAKQVGFAAPHGAPIQSGREINLLASLLNGGIVSTAMFRELARGTELAKARSNVLLAIDLRLHRISTSTVQDGLRQQLNATFPHCYAFMQEDMLLALFRAPVATAELERYLKGNDLVGGLSDTFGDLLEITWHYQQARAAVFFGQLHEDAGPLFHYGSYRIDHLFSMLPPDHLADFIEPGIRELARAHDEASTMLFETLSAYVATGCSASATAQRLCVHRNTITYRLDRLRELYGIDCSTNALERYGFSCHLVQYMQLIA